MHRCLSRILIALIAACLTQFLLPNFVHADEELHTGLHSGGIGGSRIMELDRMILVELIQLARFNMRFFENANHHQRWRSWTYPLGREAGTAASFANSLIDISVRGDNFSTPDQISRSALRRGLCSAIAGNAVSGGASSLELLQNTIVMQRARKNGYSPDASLDHVKSSVQRTELLLIERDQLISSETSEKRRRVRQYESILLRRIRDQLVFEFRRWSINSRELAWRENSFFAIDAAQNFTNMISSIISLQSYRYPNRSGAAAVVSLAASSAATINPLLRNLIGVGVRKYQRNKLAKELPVTRPEMPEGLSLKELSELQNNLEDEREVKRLTQVLFLSENSEKLDSAIDRESKSIERGRQIAQQQSISGPLIGLTSVTRSILSLTAFYDYRDDKIVANRLSFSGRLSQASGQAYALVNTPYTFVKGELRKKQVRRSGQSLAQILEKRKQFLDKLEAQLNSASP